MLPEAEPFLHLEKSNLHLTQTLDSLPFSKWHIYIICALGLTWIFDGYEVTMLSLTLIKLKSYFDCSDQQIASIASFYLFGCCTGAIIFGSLADSYGRKKLFFITLGIYFISILGVTCSSSFFFFSVFRFLTGVSVGGEYTAIFAAIDEFIPSKYRGRVNITLDGAWHLGSTIASLASIFFFYFCQSENVWRLLFALGAIGAIPLLYLRKGVPESPRWLISKGREEEGRKVVKYVQNCVKKGVFMDYKENEEIQSCRKDNNLFSFFGMLYNYYYKRYPRRFLVGITLMAAQAFFYNGIFYTFSLILNKFYSVETHLIGLFMIPLSLSSFLGPLLLSPYFDTIGRRKMIFLSYVSSGILLIMAAVLFSNDNLSLFGQIASYFIIFFLASPGASAVHLIISEIFPIEIRSQSMAFFFSVGLGLGGVIAPFIFGCLIGEGSRGSVGCGLIVGGCMMIGGGVVGGMWGVDAERKSLEEIRMME